MRDYLKSILGEWILCALAAAGLAVNIYCGFDMKDVLSFIFPAIFAFELVIMFLIFLFAYTKKLAVIGAITGVVLIIACSVVFNITGIFNDEEMGETYSAFWAVLVVTAIVVFFITRPKVGCWILFAAGNFLCAGCAFLQFGINVAGYISFLVASCALIAVWVFRKNRNGKKEKKLLSGRFALQSILIGGCTMVAAALIAVLVLVPLNLPTAQLKLIQELRKMDEVHKIGVAVILPDLQDKDSNDEEEMTTEENADVPESSEETEETTTSQEETQETESQDNSPDGEANNQEEDANAIKYNNTDLTALIICCIVVIIIVGSITFKKLLRKRWYENVLKKSNEEAVILLYRFFAKRLEIVKVKRKKNLTLEEYAWASRKFTEPFICAENNFAKLTEIYVKTYYGKAKVTDEELQLFKDAYSEFYYNICDEIGKWRYILIFYRI